MQTRKLKSINKNKYRVVLNRKGRYTNHYKYKYGSVDGITISLVRGKAEISFEMTTKKSIDDFLSFNVQPFKDAYSKCYLIHALVFGTGIEINTIEICINDERYEYTKKNNDKFPFLYSMIPGKELGLFSEWATLSDTVAVSNKTLMNNDTRYAAVYSYLLSKGRVYEFDRFQNLWTAMNAVYSYIEKAYENSLKAQFNKENSIALNRTVSFAGKDGSCIGMMSYLLEERYRKITPERSHELKNVYYEFQKKLCAYESELSIFYSDLHRMVIEKREDCKYKELMVLTTEHFNVSPFCFLILGFPYYLRCKYFHGNAIEPLFMAYNDEDLLALRIVNYFLDRFLSEFIPQLFKEDFWNDKKYRQILSYIETCEPEAHKKITNGKIER